MDMMYNADALVVMFDDTDALPLTAALAHLKGKNREAWGEPHEELYQALRTWALRPKKPGVVQDNSTRIYYLHGQEQAPDRDYIERLRR